MSLDSTGYSCNHFRVEFSKGNLKIIEYAQISSEVKSRIKSVFENYQCDPMNLSPDDCMYFVKSLNGINNSI